MSASEYYDSSGAPSQSAPITSATIRAEFDAVQNGLSAKMPDLSGNGGSVAFINAGATALEAKSPSATRTALGLVPGTDVQPYDAELAAIAGLTSAADKVPYFTGSGTAALATLTALARTIIARTTAALMRGDLGSTMVGDAVFVAVDAAAARTALDAARLGGSNTFVGVQTIPGIDLGSVGQVQFPATQNPSANANCLDDYEEGTYTPTVTSVGGTYTTKSAIGEYTKIGRTVVGGAEITITTVGSGTGPQFTVPFATKASIQCRYAGSGRELVSTGLALSVTVNGSSSIASIANYNNTDPSASGIVMAVRFQYDT